MDMALHACSVNASYDEMLMRTHSAEVRGEGACGQWLCTRSDARVTHASAYAAACDPTKTKTRPPTRSLS